MEKDKEKIEEEINESKESQHVADSKEDSLDDIHSENNEENLKSEEADSQDTEEDVFREEIKTLKEEKTLFIFLETRKKQKNLRQIVKQALYYRICSTCFLMFSDLSPFRRENISVEGSQPASQDDRSTLNILFECLFCTCICLCLALMFVIAEVEEHDSQV